MTPTINNFRRMANFGLRKKLGNSACDSLTLEFHSRCKNEDLIDDVNKIRQNDLFYGPSLSYISIYSRKSISSSFNLDILESTAF